MRHIKTFVLMLIGMLTFLFTRYSFSDLETLSPGLQTYNDAVVRGVFQHKAEIQYDRDIFEDFEVFSKEMSIISTLQGEGSDEVDQKSNPVRGFDKTMPKSVFTLKADFTSQASAGTNINIKLGYKDKENIGDRMKMTFSFTPTGEGYTNEVILVDRYPTCEDGSGGLGSAAGDYYITVTPAIPTEKFGIASGTTVLKDVNFLKLTATMYPDSGEVGGSLSWFERPIENFYTFIRWAYTYNNLASLMNLYDKKSLRWRLHSDAQKVYLRMMNDEFLFGGKQYYKPVSLATQSAGTEISKMKGLFYAIRHGGSPAVVRFDNDTTSFMDAHDEFMWKVSVPRLKEPRRMVICDQAYQKFWTKLKYDRPGIELAPNDTYGIDGITTVRTGYGNLVFDLFVNDNVAEWQRLITGADPNKPFACSIIPYKIKFYTAQPITLKTEIQSRRSSDHEAEFQGAFTWLGHNLDTEAYGIIEPTLAQ